jgi:hypothetical protein
MRRATFTIPALIALVTLIGLVVALTGDGWRDWASWFALAVPVLAIGGAPRAGRKRHQP